ncbi:DUF2264 domain-containing protein [Protaetiibacter mangrovi]|uniref:DUF2264 domain-containing protein n=1 Tax=Protaetiibacter mangrovi TaxID=2970926 RepID=A0ABT1ZH68_9MICO|nr:DUF2264 domain-containing protein [Protaetiibacter mangrovi]MCS0499930.1 DUF2264 domain-containing protein [Protaetiibacter mangrovi]TPX02678.1 DUF2264 domain-containing protein [Schumannella luteola]
MREQSSRLVAAPASGAADRAFWTGYADRLLTGARAYASPGHARITPPGAEGGYGNAVDGLEGFARTFLLAGFRLVGEHGEGLDELADFYAAGIRAGVDPDAPDRWVRPDEHPQAKVEAASLALILDQTRPWIWDRLDAVTQQRVVDYLAPVVGDTSYPRNNWLWFRIVVQTFLRSVGGPWSADDIRDDLALHDSFVRADGWLSDGDERSYDHYVGWALHLYPVLWSRMQGASELAAGRTAGDVAALDRFLQDAVALVGADGSPLLQGRSLIYRFAAAAPFWVGALAEVPSTSPGALRHAAELIVRHFADHDVPGSDALLSMGWHAEWRALAQSYSGPASPYWASKGMLGVALPAEHPVWSAPAEPLPVERGEVLRAIAAPGWIVSGTPDDGIVRVVNHGTDHAHPGDAVGDSPLYAQLGYSTATSPLLDEQAWTTPLEQAVALVAADGRTSHRAGMTLLGARIDETDGLRVGVAGSLAVAHLLEPAPIERRHGSGLAGAATPLGTLEVQSLVRGPWEVRLSRLVSIEDGVDVGALGMRVGGWAVSADAIGSAEGARVTAGALTSTLVPLGGEARADVVVRSDASPLGGASAVPVLDYRAEVGTWIATLVELRGVPAPAPTASVDIDADGQVTVRWPDGVRTASRLLDSGSAMAADR